MPNYRITEIVRESFSVPKIVPRILAATRQPMIEQTAGTNSMREEAIDALKRQTQSDSVTWLSRTGPNLITNFLRARVDSMKNEV